MLKKLASDATLKIAATACASSKVVEGNIADIFRDINEYSFNWTKVSRENYIKKDFTDVFKNYINN